MNTMLLVVITTVLSSGSLGCHSRGTQTKAPTPESTIVVNKNEPSTKEERGQTIRNVDFANFTYPWIPELVDPLNPKKDLTIRSGHLEPVRNDKNEISEMGASLESVVYGDVTSDGEEDAMVVLAIRTGSQAMPRALYVYSPYDHGTRLLWTVGFGDRADGGLRKVDIENDQLLIERYNPEDSKGACCPIHFTREIYKWQQGKFWQTGKTEMLPNTEGHSSPVMRRYEATPLR